MSDFTTEDEIFAAATASNADDDATPPAPQAQEPGRQQPEASETDQTQAADQQQAPDESRQAGGDLTVALREERARIKALNEQLERERQERIQLMQMLQTVQAPRQEPKPDEQPTDPVDLLFTKPDEFGRSLVQPIEARVLSVVEHFSKRDAIREHGAEKVDEAYRALDAAIRSGAVNGEAVKAALSQSMDPYGEIMGWYENQPANAEKRLREKILEELRASGQIPSNPAQGQQPASQAPASAPSLPSLNRAIGNAGAPQSGSITDDDIFNSAPAFGRSRKA